MNNEQKTALERIDRALDSRRIAEEYLDDAIALALASFGGDSAEIRKVLGLSFNEKTEA